MGLTLGSEAAFSKTTIDEIIERAKSEWTQPLESELDGERTAHSATKAEREQARSVIASAIGRHYWRAEGVGRAAAKVLFLLLIVSILSFSLLGVWRPPFAISLWWYFTPIVAIGLSLAVASTFGVTIPGIVRAVSRGVELRVFQLILKFAFSPTDEATQAELERLGYPFQGGTARSVPTSGPTPQNSNPALSTKGAQDRGEEVS